MIQASDRDFPEDFSHENGNYRNHCFCCNNDFAGHKRRVICKYCQTGHRTQQSNLIWVQLKAEAARAESPLLSREVFDRAMNNYFENARTKNL